MESLIQLCLFTYLITIYFQKCGFKNSIETVGRNIKLNVARNEGFSGAWMSKRGDGSNIMRNETALFTMYKSL